MKLVIFGLTISSSWGNGHATLWRGLCRALGEKGVDVTFFERNTSWYAGARDCFCVPGGGELVLYDEWDERHVAQALREADAAIITSFCPDGIRATEAMRKSPCPRRIFYDLDTPVTLSKLDAGEDLPFIGPDGLRAFDLTLSFTGGPALQVLRERLGARAVAPLYGHVDPDAHRPMEPRASFAAALSWLGTYSEDRQDALTELFIEPARLLPVERFVIAGAQYPQDFPWTANIHFVRHLPPSDHAAFFCSSRLTLNVTRAAMARMGWCPSGRLFEAAACGAPIISDDWPGLDSFFEPDREIIIAQDRRDVCAALARPDADLQQMARRARARVLDAHRSDVRADELIRHVESIDVTARMEA